MTFMGYDPMALTLLAGELRRGVDDLDSVGVGRSAPVQVRILVNGARELAHRWASFTASVATCGVLEGYEHVHVEGALPGLLVATGTQPPVVGAATGGGPLPPEEVTWLLGLYHSLAAESARREGIWASGVNSASRVGGEAPERPDDPSGMLLAALASAAGISMTVAARLHLLGQLDVDAASRVLAGFGLAGADLAAAAHKLLERWSREQWWIEGSITELNPADRVLAVVASDPLAARLFVGSLADSDAYAVVLFGPNDGDVPRRLWLAATDPRYHSPHDVGVVVRDLLEVLRHDPLTASADMVRFTSDPATRPVLATDVHQRWHEVRGWVGEVVAPWQMYLTGFADLWGWSSEEGIAALGWVAAEPRAAIALADGIGWAIAEAVWDLPIDSALRGEAIRQIAWSLGAMDRLLLDAEVDEMTRQRWIWSVMTGVAHRVVSLAVGAATAGAPTPLPEVAGTAASRATAAVMDHLDGDEAAALLASEVAGLDRMHVAATALVTGLFHQMVARGRIPPDTEPPPASSPPDHRNPRAADPLIDWIEKAPLPEDVRGELASAALAVTNPADRGRVAAG